MSRTSVSLLLVAIAFMATGCSSIGYYTHAVGGHLEIMQAAKPINKVVEDPKCDPELKKSLEEVRRIRDFASDHLGLPNNSSYRSYADIKRQFVTWNVFAAPEFSLQNVNWCMLVVGCVGYRGFHDKHEAEQLAAELQRQGYDTYVGGVPAYSTLGYLSDPVLNTFLKFGDLEVARLIFHELSHQLFYVEGDAVFNESFATAVENEGLRRWIRYKDMNGVAPDVSANQKRYRELVELVSGYRGKLQEIYGSDLPVEAKRQAKAELMSTIRESYFAHQQADGKPPVYKDWLEVDLNNAKLSTLSMYTQLLPEFEAMIEAEDHDLPRFYRRVAAIGKLPYAERRYALQQAVTHQTIVRNDAAGAR